MASQRHRTWGYIHLAIRSSCATAVFPVSMLSEATWSCLLLYYTTWGHQPGTPPADTTRDTSWSTSWSTGRVLTEAPAGGRGTGAGCRYPSYPPLYHPLHPWVPTPATPPPCHTTRYWQHGLTSLGASWGSVSDPPGRDWEPSLQQFLEADTGGAGYPRM